MISVIRANEILDDYISGFSQRSKPLSIKETSLGVSGEVGDFDLAVPGIMIIGIIMLMFSATIAIVAEVESKTIIRLKLSRLSSFELLSGISLIQIMIGLISVLLTLVLAVWLGFNYKGSFLVMLFIAVLTSISIIAFSLIIAAVTKTVNEVMVVSNFPLFLFWFFSGAAFPIRGNVLFTVAGYPVTLQGLMSPAHSVDALKKVLIMEMGFLDILPEISALIILTAAYFILGVWAFNRRHMKIE
jgi:ABC-2 type transport system permease protein